MAKKKTKKKEVKAKPNAEAPSSKRIYVKQTDVPSSSLDEALRIPAAIVEHYAGKPTAPLYVAKALNIDPKGSQLKVLSGAAIAFGLIEGGAQAASISVTDLARRILRPKKEGEDVEARRQAVLRPRVFSDFLQQYDNNSFPRQDLALNVLEDMGVPRPKTGEVLDRLVTSARAVGFLEEINGKSYVSLQGATRVANEGDSTDDGDSAPPVAPPPSPPPGSHSRHERSESLAAAPGTALATAIADDQRRRRVFITHGKNRNLIEPIKKLLEFGEMLPVVSVERQTVSKPVPEKVMDDMRGCGAAIIHVDVEQVLQDKDGKEHIILNPNVLIEIGAAMAFYGRRFILLVQNGAQLPSNLQGLYRVQYDGQTIDSSATIKLLEAIKDIKNHALPTDPPNA